jgi:hypothetical protein
MTARNGYNTGPTQDKAAKMGATVAKKLIIL